MLSVRYKLRPQPLSIDAIVVSLDRPVVLHHLIRNGFVRRLQRGLGIFITPYAIEKSTATSTEQLLAGFPGLSVGSVYNRPRGRNPVPDGSVAALIPRTDIGEMIRIAGPTGGWCTPFVYVDGQRIHYDPDAGFTLTDLVDVGAVEAIEVYRRPAEIPVEYSGGRVDLLLGTDPNCGVLVVWTKLGLAPGQRGTDGKTRNGSGSEVMRLPSVSAQGLPPEAGERIRMQLDSQVAEALGLTSPWEGTFLMVREDRLIANDPSLRRAVTLPLSGVEVLQVHRERAASHAIVRGALAGTATAVGTWLSLTVLCVWSKCEGGVERAWLPGAITGVAVGFLVKSRGPGSHWVEAAVPELERSAQGAALSWRLQVRRP